MHADFYYPKERQIFWIALVLLLGISVTTFSQVDSLRRALSQAQGEVKGKVLSDLCWELRFQNPDSAKFFGRQALEHASHNNNKSGKALALNDLAIIYILQSEFTTALELLKEAKELEIELKNDIRVAAINNKLGIIYSRQGNLEAALEVTLESINTYIDLKMDYDLAQSLNNAATIFYDLNNYEEAMEYYEKSIEIKIRINDLEGAAGTMNNVANVAYDHHEYKRSLSLNRRALHLLDSVDGSVNYKSSVYAGIGSNFMQIGKLDSAEWAFNNALIYKRHMDDKRGIAVDLNSLAQLYMGSGKLTKAWNCLDTARQLALETKSDPLVSKVYQSLSKYNSLIGDAENTYKYAMLSYAIRDSIVGNESRKAIARLQTQFETELKEKQIAQLSEQSAQASLAISKQRNWIVTLVFGVLLTMGIGWFLMFRRKKKAQAELTTQELSFRKKLLDSTVLIQEEERQRIAKDLHDGLVQTLAVLKLGVQNAMNKVGLSEAQKPEFAEHIHQIDEAANEARNISHQMMPRALMESGLVIALDDMLSKTLGHGRLEYRFEHFALDEERFKTSVEVSLYRICQELVNNIIKHSAAKRVDIQLFKTKSHLVLHVEDDGVGFNLTDRQKQSGIGLSNIFSRASSVDGEVSFERGASKGTVANVRVPLA